MLCLYCFVFGVLCEGVRSCVGGFRLIPVLHWMFYMLAVGVGGVFLFLVVVYIVHLGVFVISVFGLVVLTCRFVG